MYSKSRLYNHLLWLSTILVSSALYMTFIYAPPEKVMGAVQRIFYFHVASAIASYATFACLFFAAIGYLVTKNNKFDSLGVAAAEVGFLLSSIVLGSGMIWGKAAWGVWFNMEPRLVSFLLLWFFLLAYMSLRHFAQYNLKATHSAVLAIVICITVPLMVFSIKLLPAFQQLHPEVLEKGGLDPKMRTALVVCILAMLTFQALLVALRYRIERVGVSN